MASTEKSLKNKKLVIAVDGPAASGKGTLARKIANYFDLIYLDTGKIYRAVGYRLINAGIDPESLKNPTNLSKAIKIAKSIKINDLSEQELGSEEVGRAASISSAVPEIRAALLDFQRKVAKSRKGAVLDGRDIGTVVCPNADFKLFITASLEARARRRYKELQKKGNKVIYTAVLKDLKERDERDSKRAISPLVAAKDSIHVDTTDMNENAVFEKVISIILQDRETLS